jgi:hypothetical protein
MDLFSLIILLTIIDKHQYFEASKLFYILSDIYFLQLLIPTAAYADQASVLAQQNG